MADKKISELNAVSLPLTGSEEYAIAQGGETKKIPSNQVKDFSADHYKGTYNILTDSPPLLDATGSVGDYYRASHAGTRNFGSGAITVGVGDILSHNGSIWYKQSNNNQAGILTTTAVSITSKDLGLNQNVKGLVTYINALNTVLTVGSNEEVYFNVSDTGQVFKLRLHNRSFGFSETPIVEADIQPIFTDLSLAERSWSQWCAPGTGGTGINVTGGGNPLTITGTAGVVAHTLDSRLACIPFVKATGTSGAGQSCGWKETSNFNTSLIQGFDYVFIYAPDDNTAASRGFVGLFGSVSALPNQNPSTFGTPNVGLGHDTTDTNLFIMHNDNLGTSTKVSLGANFPANDNTKAYLLRITSYPVSASANAVIYWKVVEMVNGNIASGIITTELPTTAGGSGALCHAIWRNTGANATVPIVKLSKIFYRRLT